MGNLSRIEKSYSKISEDAEALFSHQVLIDSRLAEALIPGIRLYSEETAGWVLVY